MEQSNKLEVLITFSSEINDHGQKEKFSFETNGTYYIKGNNSYLLFNEKLDEAETVKTTLRWSEKEAWIKRSGTVNMKLPFSMNETTKGIYENIQGKMEMTARTDRIHSTWNENEQSGHLDIKYRLSMLGKKLGIYHIRINFKEEKVQ